MESKHNNPAGRNCGKGVSHRLQEIDDKFKKSGGIFKEYKIGELFDIHPTKSYNLTNDKLFRQQGNVPVVCNIEINNGIKGYINKQPTETANTITFSDTTTANSIFLQDSDFIGYSHVQGLYPYSNKWTKYSLMYFLVNFKYIAKQYNFNYANKFNRNIALNMLITLPTLNNELAFEYMEERIRELESERIRELESERIRELEAYLQATGLNNYILDENDRGVVNRLIENKIELKEYKVSELFTVKSSKKKFNANNINITDDYNLYPYVARGSSNNGIKGYISEDTEFLNNENTLAFGQDTATCFYQDKPYFTGDKIKILSPINFQLNNHIGLYIISSMKKTLKHLSWGQNSFNEDFIKNIKIKLPIKNNNIDFDYMEQLIKTLEKIIIKDVIDFKDKIIKTHKEICRI